MDTKDQNTHLASTGFITPDTAVNPMEAELAITTAEPMESGVSPEQKHSPTPFQDSMRRLRHDKRAMASLIIILLFVVIPIVGPFIYTHIGGDYTTTQGQVIGPDLYHSYKYQVLDRQDEGPSAQYWLGTDSIGRDLLARLMQGLRVSLAVAFGVEIMNVVLGVAIGTLAGFFGGWIDQLLARFTDIVFAFPGLLFAILVAGIFGAQANAWFGSIPFIGADGNARLIVVSLALATVGWPLMARFARGQTLQLQGQQFVEAARTAGTSNLRIILRHIVPNLLSIIIVAATLDIAGTVIGEAGLSFLGLGVTTPGSSIGLMISDAQGILDVHPWEALLPAIVLTVIVLAFSFLGDGLRDAFDPRSKD